MLEKLKKALNKSYASKFNMATLQQYSVLPISEQNGVLFVACVVKNDEVENIVREQFKDAQLKFINLPQEQFSELFNYAFAPAENKVKPAKEAAQHQKR